MQHLLLCVVCACKIFCCTCLAGFVEWLPYTAWVVVYSRAMFARFFVRSTVAQYNVKMECGFHMNCVNIVAMYVSTVITRSAQKYVKIILHFLQCGVNFETLPVLMYCVWQQEKQFYHF